MIMKKLLFICAALLVASCATPVVNQVEVYGVVEDAVYWKGHRHLKVWCGEKGRYYEVVTDSMWDVGDTVRIR